MLWNLTYADPGRWREVHAISGKPLPWWKKTGSPRLRLVDGPQEIKSLLEATSDVKWSNLQRTTSGAILYFRVRLEVYGMPWSVKEVTWGVEPNEGGAMVWLKRADAEVKLVPQNGHVHALEAFLQDAFGPKS